MSEDHLGALPRGFRLHEYRIERVLGHGGFGITYLAWDTHLEKPVAIKEYIPSDFAVRSAGVSVRPKSAGARPNYEWGLERFIQEAQTLARFHHKNIISVLRFFQENGTAYMVMEYEDGESLAQRFDRRRRLTEGEVGGILFPLLDGLEEIHRAGILHRDIKPGNIYIRADGTPVLIDFGAARQAVGTRSKSLTALVSVGYSPYEQYTAKAEQGAFTDIYSLAAVCYHAITARPPPDAPDRMRKDDMVPAVVAGRGHFHPAFLAALDRGLAVDEEDRPQSVAAWRQMLEGAISSTPLGAGAEPITLHTGEEEATGEKRSGSALAAAVLVLLMSGGAGLYAYQKHVDNQALEQALVTERQTAEVRQREALEAAERRAEESRQEAARAAREKAEAAAKRKAEEAERRAAQEARQRAEEKRRADEAARRKAEAAAEQAAARRQAEEAERRKAEVQAVEAKRRKAEAAAQAAEAERQAKEAARRRAEAEAARKAEESARQSAAEAARRAAEQERRAQAQTASRTQTGSYGGTTIAAQSCVSGSRRLLDVRIERGSSNRRGDFSDATCRDPNLFVDDVQRTGSKLRWSVPLVKATVSCECNRPGAPSKTQGAGRQGNAVTGTRIARESCLPGSEQLITSHVEAGGAWRKSDFSSQDCRKHDYYVRDIRRSGDTLFWSIPFTKAAIDCSCKRPAGPAAQRTASAPYSGDRIKSGWCVPGSQRLTGRDVAPNSAVRANQFSDRDCRNPSYTVRGLSTASGQLRWNVPFVGANISCACAQQ